MAGNFKVEVEGATKLEAEFTSRAVDVPLRIRRFVHELGTFSEYAAKTFAPNRTSLLEQNIAFEGVEETGLHEYVGVVGVRRTAFYGKWVEEGTGLYNPLSPHYIFPRSGNFMVWTEKGDFATPYSGRFTGHEVLDSKKGVFRIWATRTRGQKGQHYMERAFQLMVDTYLPERLEHLGDQL
jgi:hypothetical protein